MQGYIVMSIRLFTLFTGESGNSTVQNQHCVYTLAKGKKRGQKR